MEYGVDEGTDQLVNRPRSSLAMVVLVSSLAAAGTTAALVLAGGGRAAAVTVPVLVGLPEEEARLVAEGSKLTLEVAGSMSDPVVRPGSVARQSPLAGAKLEAGSRVQVTISRGVPRRLPNLVNLPRAVAEQRLAGLGLHVGAVRLERSAGLPDGTVVATEPPAGSTLAPGTSVELVLSQAGAAATPRASAKAAPAVPAGPTVAVPKVVGVRLRFAGERLRAAGLVLGKVSREADEDHIEDYVLRQSPEAGAAAPRGSAVDLVVTRND
jgi:serine/threonine-protein kinase